ncbi:MAG: hypothetical protein RMJ35_07865 [Phycisphaerales bacterium]|nr:hypothetical protein [Phycisphaerales bacterium]
MPVDPDGQAESRRLCNALGRQRRFARCCREIAGLLELLDS